MLRVLHVYSGNLNGGVETILKTLAAHRDLCSDMEPHFALCFEGGLARGLRAPGISPVILGDMWISRPWTVMQARTRFAKLLRQQRFDVVFCHSAWPHMIFAPVVRAAGIPLVLCLHDASDGSHWTDRRAARIVPDLVICNSEFTKRSLAARFPGTPTLVFYYPVGAHRTTSLEAVEEMRLRFDTAPDSVVIVQPSRMEPYKGHRFHLQVLGLLRGLPNWTCWMAGAPQSPAEEEYFNLLKEDARRYGIADRVRFVGWVDDIPTLLAASQIHCQPCVGPEPFGLTFIEAMMASLPVVTTALGGAMEIITPNTGVLVSPGDPEALATALGDLIHNSDLRTTIGRAARVRASEICDPARQLHLLASAAMQVANHAIAS